MWKCDIKWMFDETDPIIVDEIQQVCDRFVEQVNSRYGDGKVDRNAMNEYNGRTNSTVYSGVVCDDIKTRYIAVQFFNNVGTYQHLEARCVIKWKNEDNFFKSLLGVAVVGDRSV
jgi:hypothetical protein